MADQHGCHELKEACIQFVAAHAKERIVETEGYKNLKRTRPSTCGRGSSEHVKTNTNIQQLPGTV
uniref:BPM/SPOP BACK domain-containing protein n=1 Tax=Oryza brachyantha TaxID=4533 RepID=J3MQ22_ORYBR